MNWTRAVADRPIADRMRRMLALRVILAAVVLTMWWLADAPHGDASTWLGWALAWPATSALTLLPVRLGDRPARTALTATLLVDGLLLGAATWALGGTGFLVVLHAVAVTLLASYRTGVRLAFWHSLVAMLLIDTVGLGLLPDTGSWTWASRWPFFAALWGAVLITATLVARQRRQPDREVLDRFEAAVSVAPEPAATLAEFGMAELSGRRAAVFAYGGGSGVAALIDDENVTYVGRPGPESAPGPESVVRRGTESGFLLLRGLDDRTGEWLASALPGARNVVVVPIANDRMVGALAVEVGANTVERHAVETTVQAVRRAANVLVAR